MLIKIKSTTSFVLPTRSIFRRGEDQQRVEPEFTIWVDQRNYKTKDAKANQQNDSERKFTEDDDLEQIDSKLKARGFFRGKLKALLIPIALLAGGYYYLKNHPNLSNEISIENVADTLNTIQSAASSMSLPNLSSLTEEKPKLTYEEFLAKSGPKPKSIQNENPGGEVMDYAEGSLHLKLTGYKDIREVGVGSTSFAVAYPANKAIPKFQSSGILSVYQLNLSQIENVLLLRFSVPVNYMEEPDGTIRFFTEAAANTERAKVSEAIQIDEAAGTIAKGRYIIVRSGGVKLRSITDGVSKPNGGSLQRNDKVELTGKLVQVSNESGWLVEAAGGGKKLYFPLQDAKGNFTISPK